MRQPSKDQGWRDCRPKGLRWEQRGKSEGGGQCSWRAEKWEGVRARRAGGRGTQRVSCREVEGTEAVIRLALPRS